MLTGTVKKLVAEKRYGFIRSSEGVEDFFHQSGLEMTTVRFDELQEGDRVAFRAIAGEKGPRAIEVRTL